MSLHVLSADGEPVREEGFEMPYSGISHDWGVTREHLIFPIMPVTVDIERVQAGGTFYAYEPKLPSKWGIVPRDGTVDQIRWFDIPGIVIGHIMNAHTDGEMVHVDATVAHGNPFTFFPTVDGDIPDPRTGDATITRISFDLGKPDDQAVTMTPVPGATGDMPRLDERLSMSHYRYGYFACTSPTRFGVGQIDWATRKLKVHDMPGSLAREAIFVPRATDAPEDDGFVLTVVSRHRENRADLVILDRKDVTRSPIAIVKLPFNQPYAFNGCWVPDA